MSMTKSTAEDNHDWDDQYDAQSRPDTVTYGNGIVETNTYDIDRGWITRRDYKDGATNKFYFNNSGIDAVGDILPSQE